MSKKRHYNALSRSDKTVNTNPPLCFYGFVGLFTPIWEGFYDFFVNDICQSFLYFISFFTLIFSIFYQIIVNSISNNIERKIFQKVMKRKSIKVLFIYAVATFRWFSSLSLKDGKYIAMVSALYLWCSITVRFQVICGVAPTNIFLTIYFVLIYILFFVNALFRVSVTLGSALSARHPNLMLILTKFFEKSEKV